MEGAPRSTTTTTTIVYKVQHKLCVSDGLPLFSRLLTTCDNDYNDFDDHDDDNDYDDYYIATHPIVTETRKKKKDEQRRDVEDRS